MEPQEHERTWLRDVLVALAGPAATVSLMLVTVEALRHLGPDAALASFARTIVGQGTALLVVNLLPFTLGGRSSDGHHVLTALRDRWWR